MGQKISWRMVLDDFKMVFPNRRKEVVDYRPHDFMTIKLWFKDGSTATYNGLTRKLIFLPERWKGEASDG